MFPGCSPAFPWDCICLSQSFTVGVIVQLTIVNIDITVTWADMRHVSLVTSSCGLTHSVTIPGSIPIHVGRAEKVQCFQPFDWSKFPFSAFFISLKRSELTLLLILNDTKYLLSHNLSACSYPTILPSVLMSNGA